MLFGEYGCRREQSGLLAVHSGDEGGAHGHFRLAVSGVAAHEAVHGARLGHVALHVGDGARLVFSLLVGKRRLELRHAFGFYVVREARDHGAARLRLEKRRREILHRSLCAFLLLRPSPAVEAVQLHLLAFHANVARQKVGV